MRLGKYTLISPPLAQSRIPRPLTRVWLHTAHHSDNKLQVKDAGGDADRAKYPKGLSPLALTSLLSLLVPKMCFGNDTFSHVEASGSRVMDEIVATHRIESAFVLPKSFLEEGTPPHSSLP